MGSRGEKRAASQDLKIRHTMPHSKQYCPQSLNYTVSTFAIVTCNITRNVAEVEASSTSATFHATVCHMQRCTQWCDVAISQSISLFK